VKRSVAAALQARASATLGDDASALEYACDYIAAGGTISALAEELGRDIGRRVSRPLVSGILHGLAPDAAERLDKARREGAHALVEQAVKIADEADETTAAVQKAGLQVRTRQWTAEKFSPADFGTKAVASVNVSFAQLFLEALKAPLPQRPAEPALVESVDAAPDFESPSE
jgi:hypothetical protein